MSIKIGDRAPEFALYSSEKKVVKLSDFKGQPRLVLFFPLAYSGVCTEEMCAVNEDFDRYADLNATVFGISVDSVYVLDKFKKDFGLKMILLSDFNKEASRAYRSIHEVFGFDMIGVAKRSAFVIDQRGIIRYIEILDNPGEQPNFEAIKQCLASL